MWLIKYITCMHSFKAALIAFLVTSWLNWPRHCMHVVYSRLEYERIQATARAGAFVGAIEEHARAASTVPFPRSWSEVESAPETSPVWCGSKNVLRLNKFTSCQEKKWQTAVVSGVANPSPCIKHFLRIKLKKLMTCVNALILTPLIIKKK